MKKALIIFIIVFLSTLLIPLISLTGSKEQKASEIVTIFASANGVVANED